MAGIVSIPVPNLVSGVSQQPSALRLPTAVDLMENTWPSVVSGASKRPPIEYLADLGSTTLSNVAGTIIDKNPDYQYIVTIADGTLRVFDLNGNEKTVLFPQGKSYLIQATDPSSAFKFVSIGDTTFVLNREISVKSKVFGELTTNAYVPAGQAFSFDYLPDANTLALDTVYQTTSDSKYWKNTFVTSAPEVDQWVSITEVLSAPTTADPQVDALPSPSGPEYVGSLVWLKIPNTYYEYVYVGPPYYWLPVARVKYTYQQYQKVVKTPAMTAHNAWVETPVATLVSSFNSNRLDPTYMGTVFVTNSAANTYYAVYVNGVLKAQKLTSNGINFPVEGTSAIASALATALNTAGYTTQINGSTITITNLDVNDTMQGWSSAGDKLVKCFRNTVNSFSDLPPNSPQGRLLKVAGDLKTKGDDYYVVFEKGVWVETFGWMAGSGLDASTMPWKLLKNPDGTFTFMQHYWRNRPAGDGASNMGPSFVGYKLNDMFLYANRLSFLTDSNLIMSATSSFESFYRTTLASLQDSDPIDLAVASQQDDNLRHAIPFNKDVLIMADKTQYRFTYTQFVGPKNIQVNFTTSFNVAKSVYPVNMGTSIYFADDGPTYLFSKVFEYFPRPNQQGDDASETTEPVPTYVPTGVFSLTGSPRMEMLSVLSKTDPSSIYCYKYFWAGDKKVQNAWHKWPLPDVDNVKWIKFNRNYLYTMTERNGSLILGRIRTDEELLDAGQIGKRVLLDNMVTNDKLVMSYDGTYTTLTFPYYFITTPEVVTSTLTEINVRESVERVVPSNKVKVRGDITSKIVFAGIPYTMKLQFSTPYIRAQAGGGQVAILDGRLQIRYFHVEYHKTSYFKATVSCPGRPDSYVTFDANMIDNPRVSLAATAVLSGQFKVPIMARNLDTTLTLTNDSPFNCSFGAAEWTALYTPRTKRVS